MTNACTITEPMRAIAPPMTNSIAAEYGGKPPNRLPTP
jgi:hypothetical protein